MGYIVPWEIFENMLQLKRFGLYFGEILNREWLLSHRNNQLQRCSTVRGHAPRNFFEKIDAIWCVLMYYFDEINS